MRTIMSAKTPQDSFFSLSRRFFSKKKLFDEDDDDNEALNSYSHFPDEEKQETLAARNVTISTDQNNVTITPRLKRPLLVSLSKLKSALFGFHSRSRSCSTFMGTLFGYRRGHVHLAFQEDPKLNPTFLIELATPTSVLVKEMASGLVRVALECEKNSDDIHYKKKKGVKLVEDMTWRTYWNGKKCGFAMRRDCGVEEWKVMKGLEAVSMGEEVLPRGSSEDGEGGEGEMMYMRARFERVVGSKDSEAYYMINPDGSAGPELSVYLLRV